MSVKAGFALMGVIISQSKEKSQQCEREGMLFLKRLL
jgi:hypothetical protein